MIKFVCFLFILFNIRSLLFTIEFMDCRFDVFWCISCADGGVCVLDEVWLLFRYLIVFNSSESFFTLRWSWLHEKDYD